MAINIKLLSAKFAVEAIKHCDQLEKELLVLEANGFSKDILDSVFRTAHTLKGAARMLKLTAISEVAHRMEDVFELIRSGERTLSREIVDLLLQGVDTIRQLLATIADEAPLPEVPPSICAELTEVLTKETSATPETHRAPTSPRPVQELNTTPSKEGSDQQHSYVQIRAERLDELIQLMGEMVSFQYRKNQQTSVIREITRLSATSLSLLSGSEHSTQQQELTNTLSTLHNQLVKFQTSLRNDAVFENLLTTDLQERSLKIRMLPIATIFDKINRAVRDLARTTDKEIDFQIEGGNTELDRKIIEQLADCLLHMVRNAVDHGIEMPQDRLAAGKKPQGTIKLMAFYDSGGVTIALQDDGAGIAGEHIKAVAIKKQLLTKEAADKLTETDLLDLLFLPGFSTSPIITDLSGRGVGMNVVRQTVIEKLKGSIQIQTHAGNGTTILLKVPITLALCRMLLVATNNHTFALPAYSVQEILLIPASQVIQVVGKQALRVREQIVPLEELAAILQCPPTARLQEQTDLLVIILSSGAKKLGVIVDAILSEADMVIKPLPAALQDHSLISGFTVGSSDEIISVLTVASLLKQASENNAVLANVQTAAFQKQHKTVLVVDDSANTRDIVKSILESYGYHVDLAEDGLAALEKTNQKVYDAVITDVEMPQFDGFSLTSHLRQDERYRQIPVIIVTSREKPEDKRRGIQVGANAYIVKGAFDQNNLIETLQNIIG
ncbi:MAG: chemotaxis histidine kinaselike protein [Firmicutes bacterium]|nr:chemotaxis histidine kinaselike protein [Bacillota bacterium]